MVRVTLPSGGEVPVEGVLFDNDGTLVDTRELLLQSFRYATRTVLGTELPDEVYLESVGTPLADQMNGFAQTPEQAAELLRVYREYNHQIHDQMIRPFPGMAEALEELSCAGVKMGVVTSKLHALAWHGLEVTGLAKYFDFLIGPDDCPEHKPAPGPVLEGCRRMNLPPAACVYVGDSAFDMQAGNAAGTTTVAVLWGMASRETLEAERPDIICAGTGEFAKLFR